MENYRGIIGQIKYYIKKYKRLLEYTKHLEKRNLSYKVQGRAMHNLFKKLIAENRITKEELSQYIKKRN